MIQYAMVSNYYMGTCDSEMLLLNFGSVEFLLKYILYIGSLNFDHKSKLVYDFFKV